MPVINRPTRVTKTTVTAIYPILKNSFVNKTIETRKILTDVSDHFPIFLTSKLLDECLQRKRKVNFYKRFFMQIRLKNFEIPLKR